MKPAAHFLVAAGQVSLRRGHDIRNITLCFMQMRWDTNVLEAPYIPARVVTVELYHTQSWWSQTCHWIQWQNSVIESNPQIAHLLQSSAMTPAASNTEHPAMMLVYDVRNTTKSAFVRQRCLYMNVESAFVAVFAQLGVDIWYQKYHKKYICQTTIITFQSRSRLYPSTYSATINLAVVRPACLQNSGCQLELEFKTDPDFKPLFETLIWNT